MIILTDPTTGQSILFSPERMPFRTQPMVGKEISGTAVLTPMGSFVVMESAEQIADLIEQVEKDY